MLKLRILLVLLFVALFASTASAGAHISGSSPVKFLQGNYNKDTIPFDVNLDPPLPQDVTGFNVGTRVKLYVRSEGNFEELFISGWSRTALTSWLPKRLLKNQGYVQVKVTLDGVDSNIYNIPILAGPTQPPAILKIYPDPLPLSKTKVLVHVYVQNLDDPEFTGVSVNGKGVFLGALDTSDSVNDNGGAILCWVPPEYLAKPGTCNIQAGNRVGLSSPRTTNIGHQFTTVKPRFQVRKAPPPQLQGTQHTVQNTGNNQ